VSFHSPGGAFTSATSKHEERDCGRFWLTPTCVQVGTIRCRSFQTDAGNEDRASLLGIILWRARLWVFTIAGAFAAGRRAGCALRLGRLSRARRLAEFRAGDLRGHAGRHQQLPRTRRGRSDPACAERRGDTLHRISRVRHLTKAFGGVRAIDDVSLVFPSGSLSAVIGPNGAGKTTFFNPISGAFSTDAGQVLLEGQDAVRCSKAERMHRGIGRAFQVASCFSTMTVADNLMASLPMSAAGAISRAAFLRPASASAPKR